MGLFSKEKECPNCRNIVLKKDIVYYAVSLGEGYKTTKMIKMCRDCAMEKFYEVLLNYKDSLALVSPIMKSDSPMRSTIHYNSYQAYNFEECIETESLQNNDEPTIELVNGFKNILPPKNIKCNRCNNSALHSLCDSMTLFNDPFQWEFNKEANYEYLCPECIVKAFDEILSANNIFIKDGIIAPCGGEGFLCSWQL